MSKSSYYESDHYEHFRNRMAWLCREVFQHPSPNDLLGNLSEGDRAMFYVISLVTQVGNGGLHEYLCGPHGEDIEVCIHYLKKISAFPVANILTSLVQSLPEGYCHHGRDQTERALNAFLQHNGIEKLEELFPIDIDEIDMNRLLDFCELQNK